MRYDVDVFTFGRKSVSEEKDRIRRKNISRKKRRRQLRRRIALTVTVLVAAVAVVAAVRYFGGRSGSSTGTTAVTGSSSVSADEALHLSFPQLIVDDAAAGANGSDSATDGITVSEFNQILAELYKNDYVLVDFYSLTHLTQQNGYQTQPLSLPEGKKPLVISVRAVSYEGTWEESGGSESVGTVSSSSDVSATSAAGTADAGADTAGTAASGTNTAGATASGTDNTGTAAVGTDNTGTDAAAANADQSTIGQKAVGIDVDSSGAVVNQIRDESGATQSGAYDVMTCIDAFIANHPDFSYNNARGVIAVTGEEGVLGYDPSDADQSAELQKIVKALKDEGWIFASGTYGNISYGSEYSIVKEDAEKWQSEVGASIGDTDILVLPDRADIGSWAPYSSANEKFSLLSGEGFVYYCSDNSDQLTWLETGTDYVRQGIHEIDTMTEFETLIDQGIDAYSALIEKEAQQEAESLKSGGTDSSQGSGSDQSNDSGPESSNGSGSDQSDGSDKEINNIDHEV
jgi:hypothetical protein